MRVTSASASINSLLASAASRTLYDFARSEPGMTRIFGTGMGSRGRRTDDRGQIKGLSSSVVCPLASIPAVHPHPRRRNVHPHALGSFRLHPVKTLRERRDRVVGELN